MKYTHIMTDEEAPISHIIRKSVSSMVDLRKLSRSMGLNVKFDWIDNYDPDVKLQVLNIDADHIGGTHWIAVYDNKYYFDPLGLPVARDWLNHLEYTYIPIQNASYGHCGQYCVLFLWYANKGEIDRFYTIF